MAQKYYRSDQAVIHVEVSGVSLDHESWDVMEGGDKKASNATHFPGGSGEQVALGGLAKREDFTVQRAWGPALTKIFKQLDAVSGFAAVTASFIQLDAQYKPVGDVITYTGVLLGVERPNFKSDTSEVAFLKITCGPNGPIT